MKKPPTLEKKKKRGCVYCGTMEELTVDHKHPRSLGGSDEPRNLQWLCKRCNRIKSSIPHKVLLNIFVIYENEFKKNPRFMKRILKRIKN